MYSWPLNNMGLNCVGCLTNELSSVNTGLHDPQLVESTDVEPWTQRANYGTWASVFFGICGGSWNQSPRDIEGQLKYSLNISNSCVFIYGFQRFDCDVLRCFLGNYSACNLLSFLELLIDIFHCFGKFMAIMFQNFLLSLCPSEISVTCVFDHVKLYQHVSVFDILFFFFFSFSYYSLFNLGNFHWLVLSQTLLVLCHFCY